MILLGIDPGSVKTGYGVLSAEGREVTVLDHGVIRPGSKKSFEERLLAIHDGLEQVFQKHKPDLAVVEGTFHGRRAQNFQSTLKLAHARGVALLAAARAGVEVIEVAPADVKKSITGHGRAEKAQVQEMVKILLKLKGRIAEDAADALALALTQSYRRRPLVVARRGGV